MIANTIIRNLTLEDCQPELMKKFNRYQEIKRCWRKHENNWVLIDNPHIGQWDDKQKYDKVYGFIECINTGGTVIGAFVDDELIGFASVINNLFGSNNDYVQLE